WTPIGAGNAANGQTELFWQGNENGRIELGIWQVSGTTLVGGAIPPGAAALPWHVATLGNFFGDGNTDPLWANASTGQFGGWQMSGDQLVSAPLSTTTIPTGWNIVSVGNFFGTGRDALLLQSPTGQLQSWSLNGATVTQQVTVGGCGPDWRFAGVGSFQGDGN